jgi:ketol-acid reductoisomerase
VSQVFYERDVDPAALAGQTVAVLGYGIQGRAQALCFRDSGVPVVVGNRADEYRECAAADGFEALEVADAVRHAIQMLLPDEAQPAVFEDQIRRGLSPGKALVFAHGLAVRYRLIVPPTDVDCLLLAPRMPGVICASGFLPAGAFPPSSRSSATRPAGPGHGCLLWRMRWVSLAAAPSKSASPKRPSSIAFRSTSLTH